MKAFSIRNPLTIIGLFSSITEGLSIYALPKLTEDNQNIFIWFIVLFPSLLVGGFFFTLVKHHTKLYSPSDFDSKDVDFILAFLQKPSEHQKQNPQINAVAESFVQFQAENLPPEDTQIVFFINNIFSRIDSNIQKEKLVRLYYKAFNANSYLLDIEIKSDQLNTGEDGRIQLVVIALHLIPKPTIIVLGAGIEEDGTGNPIVNYVLQTLKKKIKN